MLTALDRAKTARKALDNAPGGRIRQSMNQENPEDTARQVAETADDPLAALRASGAIRSASSLTTEPESLPLNNHEKYAFFALKNFGVAARYGAGSRRPGRSIRY